MTTGASALTAVATGIYTVLNVAGYTALCPGGVYEDIPQATTSYPVSWYSLREQDGGGATFGKGGKELTLRLRVWDSSETYRATQLVMGKAAELLHHTLPAVTGYTSLLVVYEGAFPLPDDEIAGVRVKVLEGVFRILVEQA